MSKDDPAVIAAIEKFSFAGLRESATSMQGRVKRESRPVSRSDRRAVAGEARITEQINLKVDSEFASVLRGLARGEGRPIVQIVRDAIELYTKRQDT